MSLTIKDLSGSTALDQTAVRGGMPTTFGPPPLVQLLPDPLKGFYLEFFPQKPQNY